MTTDPNRSNFESVPGAVEGEPGATPGNNDAAQAAESESSKAGEGSTEASVEEQLRAEAARLKDQLLRLAADFDNFRKRSRREILDSERMAREELLRELLPVFDNLERASQHADAVTDISSLIDGIAMVSRQFTDTLSKLGVERVKTVGVAFDPSVHEAVQQIETADQPPGAVCAEILGGYKYGDRLIRPAMVVVAKASSNA